MGSLILNGDDAHVRGFADRHPGRSILFGLSADAEVRAENVELLPKGGANVSL